MGGEDFLKGKKSLDRIPQEKKSCHGKLYWILCTMQIKKNRIALRLKENQARKHVPASPPPPPPPPPPPHPHTHSQESNGRFLTLDLLQEESRKISCLPPVFTPLVFARNALIYFLAGFQKISTVMYLSLNLNYFYFMFSPILQHLNCRYKWC